MNKKHYRWGLYGVIGLMILAILVFVLRTVLFPAPVGPRQLALSGNTVWINSHGALHHFDAAGKRLQHVAWRDWGLSDKPTSLQWTQDNVFWVHDQNAVFRCTLAPRHCDKIGLAELGARPDVRTVRVNDDETQMVVADTSEHRILYYQKQDNGQWKLIRDFDQGFKFPNQFLWQGQSLWVTNTNHNEISRLQLDLPASQSLGHFSIDHRTLRPMHRYPFALTQDQNGQHWALLGGMNMSHADLLLMDAQYKPLRTVELSDDQDPVGVLAFGPEVLVSDMTKFRIDRLDLNGKVKGLFGDAGFLQELNAAHDKALFSSRLPNYLMYAIVGLVLLGALFGWKSGELQKSRLKDWDAVGDAPSEHPRAVGRAVTSNAAPVFSPVRAQTGITRVDAIPGALKTRKKMAMAFSLAFPVLIGIMAYVAWPYITQFDCKNGSACSNIHLITKITYILVILVSLVLPWQIQSKFKHIEKMKIATDGKMIAVRLYGKTYKCPAEHALLTNQMLFIGINPLPLRLQSDAIFDEPELKAKILNRLPQLPIVGTFELDKLIYHFWDHCGIKGRLILIAFLVPFVMAGSLAFIAALIG